MNYYIPDPAERAEMAFESRLERYIAEARADDPKCTWREAEDHALWRMNVEDEGDRV
jgi:hypothetical protein